MPSAGGVSAAVLRSAHGADAARIQVAEEIEQAIQSADAIPEAFRAYDYSQIKNGSREEGRTNLRRYLEMRPDAPDVEMIRFTLGQ